MRKFVFKVFLALHDYKLLAFDNDIVVGYNANNGVYAFWLVNEYGMLVLFDTCDTCEEAEFKYNIIIGGMSNANQGNTDGCKW